MQAGLGVRVKTSSERPVRMGGWFPHDIECGPLPPPAVLATECPSASGWEGLLGRPQGEREATPRQWGPAPARWKAELLPRLSSLVWKTGHPQTSGLLPPGSEAAPGRAGDPGRLLGTEPSGGRCAMRGLCVSHACHNAWLALPGAVIEIHCQIY